MLVLAAVNLTARLDREMVDVWDESLYATTALEMVTSGNWLVTTFQGEPDYYNSKPPLNAWLIALSFSAFGPGLVALRLASVVAAWLTVFVLWRWTRDTWDAGTAHVAALVLATSYPFFYVHSGRTGNADALLTLTVTLTFVVLWRAHRRAALAAWLGPLAGVAFMLKGPGALAFVMPMIAVDLVGRVRRGHEWRAWLRPALAGLAAATAVVAAWAIARWRADGWALFSHMVFYDIGARAAGPIEGHDEPWWFYAGVLARHWYDWLVGAALIAVCLPAAVGGLRRAWAAAAAPPQRGLVMAWLATTLLLPTLVPTKLAWYLNLFYPGAAVLVALLVRRAWRLSMEAATRRRTGALVATVVLAALVGEGRMVYRSMRIDIDRSAQGLLLSQRPALKGHRVFATRCPRPESFLAQAAGSACFAIDDLDTFRRIASPGDFWIDRHEATLAELEPVAANRRAALFRRPPLP